MPDYTTNFNLEKPSANEYFDINIQNKNMNIIDTEIAKKASSTQNGRMSKEDKEKLDAIEEGATNYQHPSTHPASMIAEDGSHRFISDEQIANWDTQMAEFAEDLNATKDEFNLKVGNIENGTTKVGNASKLEGKTHGNTADKILLLPNEIAQGDILRVGTSGAIERLPKGIDGQVIGYSSGLPTPMDITGAWTAISDFTTDAPIQSLLFRDIGIENHEIIKMFIKVSSDDNPSYSKLHISFNRKPCSGYIFGNSGSTFNQPESITTNFGIDLPYLCKASDVFSIVEITIFNTITDKRGFIQMSSVQNGAFRVGSFLISNYTKKISEISISDSTHYNFKAGTNVKIIGMK